MSSFVALLVLVGIISGHPYAIAADQSSSYAEITSSQIADVVELVKFVETAKPELLEKFEAPFGALGLACAQQTLDMRQLHDFSKVVEEIEAALPKSSDALLRQIKIATVLGGRDVYRPTFIHRKEVRRNISRYMAALEEAYQYQNFARCLALVSALEFTYDQPQIQVSQIR